MRPDLLLLCPASTVQPPPQAALAWAMRVERAGTPLSVALRQAERRFGVRHECLRDFLRAVKETDAQQEE